MSYTLLEILNRVFDQGNGELKTSATLSGNVTASTEYAEGATSGTITGGAIMHEVAGNTLQPVNETYPLPTKESTIPVYSTDSFQATITSSNATSATAVKSKTADKKIYITDVIVSVDTAMSVQLQDDAGTPVVVMEQMYMPANSVFSKTFKTPLVIATNQDLDVITSVSGNISVTVSGFVI